MKIENKLRNFLNLFLLSLFIIISGCENDKEPNNIPLNKSQNLTSKTISGKEIPDIINFVRNQSNDEMKFSLGLKNRDSRTQENLIIGSIQTDKIKQITNDANRSNYTFKVDKESVSNELSFINYTIKESPNGFYSYFLEYVPNMKWLKTTATPNDLSTFTGEIRAYDRNGYYIGKNTFSNGIRVEQTYRNPCDNGSTGSSSGGGGGDGSGTSTGGSGSGSGSGSGGTGAGSGSGGGGGGTGGYDIECIVIVISDFGECGCQTVSVYTCNDYFNQKSSSKNPFRNPCTDDCQNQQRTSDCEFGFDENCNCLPDPNEDINNNPNDGILIDLGIIQKFNSLLSNNLTSQQINWMFENQKNMKFTSYALDYLQNDNSIEAQQAFLFTVNAGVNNLLNSSYNSSFQTQVFCCNTPLITNPTLALKYYAYVRQEIAILKDEFPQNHQFTNWELTKIYFQANLTALQLGLDIIGLVPGFGEVADITNGVIYTIQGDGTNATLSYASTVPFVGWFTTSAKLAKRTLTLTNGSKTTLKWVVSNGNIIFSPSDNAARKQLARVLGTTGTGKHAHHIIPLEFKEHVLVQKAAKAGKAFHMNEALNGIPRPSHFHLTGHSAYNTKIQQVLDDLHDNSMSVDDAYDEVFDFIQYLENLIQNNTNLNSGQIADLISYP